jgi:hypothetical protein
LISRCFVMLPGISEKTVVFAEPKSLYPNDQFCYAYNNRHLSVREGKATGTKNGEIHNPF